MYIDGDLVAAQPLSAPLQKLGGAVAIGVKGESTHGDPFTGVIDEVRIFTRALTSCEIRELAGKACTP
jgi:hypothetical protein